MALQGNLRDFSVSEILQLLGTQRKNGCLMMERGTETFVVFVADGRIVSARNPGLSDGDPLVRFLRKIHRLSDEQYRGLMTIHQESGRDLEDLLITGRYMETEELAGFVERQILDSLFQLSHWESGSYRFEPAITWNGARIVKLSIEGALIETARRVDERKRQRATFPDPHQILGVRDLPDPDEPLSEEESELFGIIDGNHTLADVLADAPLTEYEALEALHRMMEATWVEFVGRREPGLSAATAGPVLLPRARQLAREVLAAVLGLALVMGLAAAGRLLRRPSAQAVRPSDVFTVTQIRDLQRSLELYRREQGVYPDRLDQLVKGGWITPRDLENPTYRLVYWRDKNVGDYRVSFDPLR